MKYSNYEFNEAEDKVIAALSTRLMITGVIFVAIGLPLMAMLINGNFVALSFGALYFVIGLLCLNSYASFRKIVQTTHHDLSHLMEAMKAMTAMYTLQIIAAIAAAAAFLVFELHLF
jgi:uncharacterized membrane protein (Fun14 family)